MDLVEVTGERREMVDQLLGKAAELLGDARCGFRSCYGQSENLLSLSISGDKDALSLDFGVCHDHLWIVEMAEADAPDDSALAGFFIVHLDDRFGLSEARDALIRREAEATEGAS